MIRLALSRKRYR